MSHTKTSFLGYRQMRAAQDAGIPLSEMFPSRPACRCVIECQRFMCVNRDRRQHVHFDEKPCPRHGRSNGGEE